MLSAKRKLLLTLKNLPGWTTRRKIVVFSIDDYGNIRTASARARENLEQAGLNMKDDRFDTYDALETKEDLTQLFETLASVKDKNGSHAVFTAFALAANIDFDRIINSGYARYYYELLPETFSKLPGYEGTWDLWQEGMRKNLLVPQFHGREHLNLTFFNKLLSEKHPELVACLNNRSFGGFTYLPFPNNKTFTAAFTFQELEENENHKKVIEDGLNVFEKVYGFRATHFNAPGAKEHHSLAKTLSDGGIKYIDTPPVYYEHQGNGVYKRKFSYLGRKNKFGQLSIIRNCVFEPLLNRSIDEVSNCLAQMEVAFNCNKPANISSHRVNFGGYIDPDVRAHGLKELKRLLSAIVKKWPDVEFMSANELGDLIAANKK